jgi:hypothetical protein
MSGDRTTSALSKSSVNLSQIVSRASFATTLAQRWRKHGKVLRPFARLIADRPKGRAGALSSMLLDNIAHAVLRSPLSKFASLRGDNWPDASAVDTARDALILILRTPRSGSTSSSVLAAARRFVPPNTLNLEGQISASQHFRHARSAQQITAPIAPRGCSPVVDPRCPGARSH